MSYKNFPFGKTVEIAWQNKSIRRKKYFPATGGKSVRESKVSRQRLPKGKLTLASFMELISQGLPQIKSFLACVCLRDNSTSLHKQFSLLHRRERSAWGRPGEQLLPKSSFESIIKFRKTSEKKLHRLNIYAAMAEAGLSFELQIPRKLTKVFLIKF